MQSGREAFPRGVPPQRRPIEWQTGAMTKCLPILADEPKSATLATRGDRFLARRGVLERARDRLRRIRPLSCAVSVRRRPVSPLVGMYVAEAIGRYRQGASGFPLESSPSFSHRV